MARASARYSNLRVSAGYPAWFKVHQGANVKRVTEAVADDARAGCPYDSGELFESIKERYPGDLIGVVEVGTDHWQETEYGSPPHIIRAHGDYSLHNPETGEYFGPVVHHPGTPEQPFMRPALYQRRSLAGA
jgi:hypothetical protein